MHLGPTDQVQKNKTKNSESTRFRNELPILQLNLIFSAPPLFFFPILGCNLHIFIVLKMLLFLLVYFAKLTLSEF